jgi:ankyrin repeat protein
VNLKDESLQSLFLYATKNGHSEMVQLFLTRGDVDVNLKDRGLQSLLSYVTENGPSETVQLFLA